MPAGKGIPCIILSFAAVPSHHGSNSSHVVTEHVIVCFEKNIRHYSIPLIYTQFPTVHHAPGTKASLNPSPKHRQIIMELVCRLSCFEFINAYPVILTLVHFSDKLTKFIGLIEENVYRSRFYCCSSERPAGLNFEY